MKAEAHNEKELPKIDLPEEWVCGTDINIGLLKLYTNCPVRLKCEVIVLCTSGEVEASVNLSPIGVHAGDMVVLRPGSVLQIHSVSEGLKIYFIGFSSQYITAQEHTGSTAEALQWAWGDPVVALKPQGGAVMESYMQLLVKLYKGLGEEIRREVSSNLYADTRKCLSLLYRNHVREEGNAIPKSESLSRSFIRLVMQHYAQTRNVAWYAARLGITHAYLCSIVKQNTGKTCAEIIASMVIMDARTQLKSTRRSIQEIADALSFANVSFFGKYFKRYVGMSPLDYRNNG